MILNVKCAVCGVEMAKEVEEGIPDFILDTLKRMTIHDECAAERARQADAQREKALFLSRVQQWQQRCPELYRDFDPAKCANLAMSDRIANWEPSGGLGLSIVGPSRSGKTRAVFRMLERHFLRGKKIFFCSGVKWTKYSIDAAKGDQEAARMIKSAHTADITFIDDFAKNAWTERVETEFWDMMETRAGALKPVILTSTETGEDLMHRMGQASRDIIGRIREFCEPVIWR